MRGYNLPILNRSEVKTSIHMKHASKQSKGNSQRKQGRSKASQPEESIKETLESVVMAFVLAFVFRAYVVEAFVIPTGSMAPTLLGAHMLTTCEQCGYRFDCDWPPHSKTRRSDETIPLPLAVGTDATCPMCHYPTHQRRGARRKAGDRILVHKYIFSVSEPRRCDVIVFKNPSRPDQNYIKRLMGLPQERLWIIDGNVYVQSMRKPNEPWRIVHKSVRPEVQRAVWQPIYHSSYVPLDNGIGPDDDRDDPRWTIPWRTDEADQWDLANRRSYRHKAAGPGALWFDFDRAEYRGPGQYAYNQFSSPEAEPIEDVRVAAGFEPDADGLSVELSTTIRVFDAEAKPGELVPVIGRIDSQGRPSIEMPDPETGEPKVRRSLPGKAEAVCRLPAGKSTEVELWYVDQEASLWVDGKCVVRWPFELSMDIVKGRPFPDRGSLLQRPEIGIKVDGPAVTLNGVQIDRDIYYSSQARSPDDKGMLVKRMNSKGRVVTHGKYIELEADRFFCLGDNSPQSHDSRYWRDQDLNPWIRQRLLEQDSQQTGVVPRELIMGRAFFVYFPPPYSWRPETVGIIPNFGDLRFIH